MEIIKPAYFPAFACIAGRCPDSCCQEWAVQVDEASAEYYRQLPGPLGNRLRQVLTTEDGETILTIQDGRCPMWRDDGLCRIQAELGEAALCRTCREFPRLTHDYGDFVELGLELSCPEAARLILSAQETAPLISTAPGGEREYDPEAMAVLKATRQTALALLSHPTRPVGETLALLLMYGAQAQGELDGGASGPFPEEAALESARTFAQQGDITAITEVFKNLELLTQDWAALLRNPVPASWEQRHLALARYLVHRYWFQAVADYDLYSRVKFTVVACLLVRHLGGDLLRTAQLFSKEIENDADNVDALLDAAYDHPAFADAKLLGLLLAD